MKNRIREKRKQEARRARRVRARIQGTAERPRLTVKRSLKHIYAQLIDDTAGRTLAAASDMKMKKEGKPLDRAVTVGKTLGEAAVKAGITSAVADRGQYRYHGRVRALIEATGLVKVGERREKKPEVAKSDKKGTKEKKGEKVKKEKQESKPKAAKK